MRPRSLCNLELTTALLLVFLPMRIAFGAAPAKMKTQDFKGKVVALADLLKKSGAPLDPEAAPHWLALVTAEGKVYPLIKDDGSRMFFNDPRLLDRPMLVTGRLLLNSHLLQVVDVHSYVKGRLCEVYYWCDICSIRRNQKQICDCCGAEMTLREVPVKR